MTSLERKLSLCC